jgi:hypothetical protein
MVLSVSGFKRKAVWGGLNALNRLVGLYGQVMRLRKMLEVCDHLVTGWEAVWRTRKWSSGQAREPCRGEEFEAVVVVRPASAGCWACLENLVVKVGLLEVVSGGQSGLARPDDDGIVHVVLSFAVVL